MSTRAAPTSWTRPTRGGRWRRPRPRCRHPNPTVDTYAGAGHLSVSLDAETTRLLLGEVPAAFHAGVHDILLIAYGLACTEFLGNPAAPIGIDVEGHGRNEDPAPDIDLSRTVGWFTTKYPVSLILGGLRWAQVVAGDAALGPVIKTRQRAAARPARRPDLRSAALPQHRRRPGRARPDHRIQLLRTPRRGLGRDVRAICGGSARTDLSVADAATAVPMPLAHTVELNAGTIDTDTGPHLQATWTWAPSALDDAQIGRLSRLWFEALAGICAHVQHGGGGLTPSDIAPARLSQQQIDELDQHYAHRRRPAADPDAAGTALPRQHRAGHGDDVYAVQLDITVTGPLDPDRLRDAVHTVVSRHPNLAARFCEQFDEPVQIIPADPVMAWRYVELDSDRSRSSSCAPPNAPRSATWPTSRRFGRR